MAFKEYMAYYFDFCNASEAPDEKLELFIRDYSEEEKLDNALITQDANVCFSFAFYCQRLNHLISIYNDTKYERVKLLIFLRNNDIRHLNHIFYKSQYSEYVMRLMDFIEILRKKLNIKSPYINVVDVVIDNITAEIDASNGDLSDASHSSMFCNAHKRSFGYAFLDRRINFYVCDNLGKLYEEIKEASTAIRRCVIIINDDVNSDVLSNLFIRYLPVKIVTVKDGKWKKWMDSRCGFRSSFQQIIYKCERILKSKKNIEPEFKKLITELNSWLYHTQNKVEGYFHNYYTLSVKKRDFIAINSAMKILSHKVANTTSYYFYRDSELIEKELNDLGDALCFYFDQSNMIYELPSTILTGIRCIREDANLYRIDAKTLFQENNLSAALKNWLVMTPIY